MNPDQLVMKTVGYFIGWKSTIFDPVSGIIEKLAQFNSYLSKRLGNKTGSTIGLHLITVRIIFKRRQRKTLEHGATQKTHHSYKKNLPLTGSFKKC
jgi:hypothetical protein